jgi:hypothetical protein
MNAEIADRIEQSYNHERNIEDIFGGQEVFGIARIVANVITEIGRREKLLSGRRFPPIEGAALWLTDPYVYDRAIRAVVKVLESLRPDGESVARPHDHLLDDPLLALELLLGDQRRQAIASIPLDKEPDAKVIDDVVTMLIAEAALEDQRRAVPEGKHDHDSEAARIFLKIKDRLKSAQTARNKE